MEKNLFANFRSIVVRHRVRLFGAFLMLLISNVLQIVNPLLLRQALLAGPLAATSVWHWASLLLSIAILSAILKFYMRISFFSVGRDAEREMRSKIFSRIQSQTQEFFDRHGTGELLSRLTNDISSYRDVLGIGLLFPLFFATLVIPAFCALFMISARLTLISSIPLIAIPLFNMTVRSKVFPLSVDVQRKLANLSNLAQENYTGIRVVKNYVMEDTLQEIFRQACLQMIQSNFKLVSLLGMILPFFSALTKLVTILLVLVAGTRILQGLGELSSADFISFIWIQSYVFFPILMLGWVLPMYERGRAAYSRFLEIYHEPIKVEEGHLEVRVPAQADIQIKNLTFRYPAAANDALKDFRLTIKGGSFVGITGPIGSGKSTLFHLLNREYEIPRETIFIGGYDLRELTFSSLRSAIVTVEQSPFLFSKTIAENVRFAMEEASQKDLEAVAQYADLHDTILSFPKKYNTVVGERGTTLSGGQKQRIAIARAFLTDRSILLFDDIFSALDSATEKKIFEIIRARFGGKTVLLITHRISILEQMDRVLYMKNGTIVEDGHPKELLKKGRMYAALAELQR
jgi:ATP-binding cassette, subfamily B, multidrug efflux pump